MKKWKAGRNYRRIKDKNGNIISNTIVIGTEKIEVTEEVFLAYSQADRRERYLLEEMEVGKVLSLEQLEEDGVLEDYIGEEVVPSAEEQVMEREEICHREFLMHILPEAILRLKNSDQDLIRALYYENISTREYARERGVNQWTIVKRRDRILRDLKKILKNFQF